MTAPNLAASLLTAHSDGQAVAAQVAADGGTSNGGRPAEAARREIQRFLQRHSAYDVLPVSFRLMMLDTDLLVKKALSALVQNGVASAPLYHAAQHRFVGMLTMTHLIRLMHRYYIEEWPYAAIMDELEQLTIGALRAALAEKLVSGQPPPVVVLHPLASLYEAARKMLQSRLRRLPLVDTDPSTQQDLVVSVLTQYRILRFLAVNVGARDALKLSVAGLGLVTTEALATVKMDTPVIEAINMFVDCHVTALPVVDQDDTLLNVYEKADLLTLAQADTYLDLRMSVEEALQRRSKDFEGVHTCRATDTLYSVLQVLKTTRVHRFVVVDDRNRLRGIVSLSDILRFLVEDPDAPEEDDGAPMLRIYEEQQ
ncbi:hypothetical protein THASP1DRAFT_12791 [Thamnocephalis sphaerospora]|uniref:CBS domain-containing protein n=1 Tax=Thamnocephalis sphaerospora TaxID=78915 RepID=A0A4P9XWV5_9FUNG|nr:hypothetical protein THASP1DRAFT_12791 [Thamnocephalis sphaerospora]|eukprot:RKP10472.1 hypothetical protein THASP1DRAFT_12791 [Thamnocephalis sphaerospora]